jgi:hypothetical protein
VFVDIDPGFPQTWRAQGLHDAFAGHDAVVTVGLRATEPGCCVGDTGLPTFATPPPVSLPHWPSSPSNLLSSPRWTTVATWRGPFGPLDVGGVRHGLRVHELRRFSRLPELLPGIECEIALEIDRADEADRVRLRDGGWSLVAPHDVASDMTSYRRYIQASTGELTIAKEAYVRSRGGWFSDRSACYLASGRPVVAQDTGFGALLPTGLGLLCFDDPEEAAAAVAEVSSDLARHAKAARQIAEEHLDARTVLRSVLERIGVW